MPLMVMNHRDKLLDSTSDIKFLYDGYYFHEGIQNTFEDHATPINLVNDCNKGFGSEVLQKCGKREVIKQLYDMTRSPEPVRDFPLVLVTTMSKELCERIGEQLPKRMANVHKYCCVTARPVYMALLLKRYDLMLELMEQGYALNYKIPMIRYFKTRDSKIVENGYSRIYTFLPDYLLHQEELSPELEEFIWCEIEKEYKIEKLEIPFMGMPYNLLAGLMGGEVPKDSEKVAELYIQKAKKLVDTHPVFFEHLGGEKIYEWNGNEKQGYEWWLYLTEKMPHSTEILKNLLKMFRCKNMLLKGIDEDSNMTDKEVWLRNFVRMNKRISKYYEANEELQHFYFAWLLNILLSITSEKSLSAMENKGKAWEDLIGILRRFWSGQHIVDVHKSMSQLPYRYQYIRNIDELKLDILNIIKELSQKPYCYRIRNGNDLDWLFMEFIRFDDIDKEMIIAGKRMVFGIRTFQYENEEVEFLEVCAYSKLMNYFLKIRKEEELLQHTLDSGLFPKSYIGRAIDAALGKGELKMVSLLLSRLS